MDLSELLDELREIEIYDTDPKDWMGYLKEDDSWDPVPELDPSSRPLQGIPSSLVDQFHTF